MTEPTYPPKHLEVRYTDRGFRHLLPITSDYGAEINVYESSAALEPCVWLGVRPEPDRDLEVAHLTLEQARQVAEQLLWLCDNHYQVKRNETKQ